MDSTHRRPLRKILQQRDREDLKEGDSDSMPRLTSFERHGQLILRAGQVPPSLGSLRAPVQNSLFASFCSTSSVTHGQHSPEAAKKDSSTKRSRRSQRRGFRFHATPHILRKARPIDPTCGTSTTFFGISVSSCSKLFLCALLWNLCPALLTTRTSINIMLR